VTMTPSLSAAPVTASHAELAQIADAAAAKAVALLVDRLFEIDIESPDARKEMAEIAADIRWVRKRRKAEDTVTSSIRTAAITIVITGLLTALWLGVHAAVSKGILPGVPGKP